MRSEGRQNNETDTESESDQSQTHSVLQRVARFGPGRLRAEPVR